MQPLFAIPRTGLIAPILFSCLFGHAAFSQLQWPAVGPQTRPWTRWWWMGSAVNRQDLKANLEKYRAAGLGGLELTPIYGVKGYEEQFIDYLSPRWMGMLSYTLQECRRQGLGLDMSTGTGWPFGGGPLIGEDYACKNFVAKTWTVKAGERLPDTVSCMQESLLHTDGSLKPKIDDLVRPISANPNLQALALFQVRFARVLPLQSLMAYSAGGQVLDLTAKVDGAGILQWTAPAGSDWTLFGIFQGWHGKMVERAAPGAEGNVIDHFSATALSVYLSRFDKAFRGHDLRGLRAFFNDSYEVDDAKGQSNWTPFFFELFRQYRGYDLRQHLPALLGKDSKENNSRVVSDFRETISDLLLDKFTRNWRSWAQGKGAIIRNQAHGSPANILDCYAASDIPETEGNDIYRYKMATSAANVTGKRLASAETVTWLGEHFLSTYADVRTALDGYLLGGVNHIFYHGTAYSPQRDPWPGWLFYAAVHFTPNDPSWQNFSALNDYVARAQSFLQQGRPDNDVLLYYPIYDSWSEPGRDLLKHYDRLEPEFNGTGFKECAEAMQRRGYAYDYISDKQLREAGVASAMPQIRTSGGRLYQTVLIPGCHYISGETFVHLVGMAEAGADILIYKALPADVPGLGRLEQRRAGLRQAKERLHFSPAAAGIRQARIGKGSFIMGDDLDSLLTYARIRRETMVDDSLEFVRRKHPQGNTYFIVNKSSRKWEGYVPLAAKFGSAAIFDPMNGRKGLADWRKAGSGTDGSGANGPLASGAGGREVFLQLEPGASCVLQTFHAVLQSPAYPYYRPAGNASPISGIWTIQFIEGGPQLPTSTTTDQLGSWTKMDGEEGKKFSGTAKYSIHFGRPRGSAVAWMLDLGKVDETAQVFLNGKKLASMIGPLFQVVISASDLRGQNSLEVRVSSGMVNRIEDMDRQGINYKKFYNYNFPAHLRENRNAAGLFDASKWAPVDAGLSGPVTITPLSRSHPLQSIAGSSVSSQKTEEQDPPWVKNVGARSFPSATKIFKANMYGAVGDGVTLATHSIQAAIDDCAEKGGGVVVLDAGAYLCGSLFLKENVELRIGKGVELKGSQRFEDYPEIPTRIAGIEMNWPAALLNIIGVKKAAITGEGRVNAQGKFCWDKYWAMRKVYDAKGLRWIVDYDAKRVRTLLVQDCSDITIRGVRFINAGFWTVQVLYSHYVTVDGITVRNNEDGHGPSTDGVDIDSSDWVLVQNCDIDCNDDDFCLKAGRDWDGQRVNRPTEYVVIRNCIARKGGGLLTIGSETAGSIRHVLATDLIARGTGNGFHIKSATTRGGTVEDIHIRNFNMDSVGNAILFTMNWNPAYSYSSLPAGYNADSVPSHWKTLLHKVEPPEKGTPHFRDIYVTGIRAANAKKAISAVGLDQSLISGVHMQQIRISALTAGEISYAKDWDLSGVSITSKDSTKLQVQHSDNVKL